MANQEGSTVPQGVLDGTVPSSKNYMDSTVPSSKKLVDGTVPSCKKLVDGTISELSGTVIYISLDQLSGIL